MNKKRAIHILLSLVLVTVMLCTTLPLTGCAIIRLAASGGDMFTFTLTESEYNKALSAIDKFNSQVKRGTPDFFVSLTLMSLYDKINYITHEYQMAQLLFYADTSDTRAYENYVFAEECYNNVRSKWIASFRDLYNSDSPLKETVFDSWSEKELKIFTIDPECIELESRVAEITREFSALPEDEEWGEKVSELYLELIGLNAQIAEYYGYDNYYDYAAEDIYSRIYTHDEREAFRSYVKEYIVPMAETVAKMKSDARLLLDSDKEAILSDILYNTCESDNEYLVGYTSLFGEDARALMDNLLNGIQLYRSTSENAYVAAYSSVSAYYGVPFVFLGKECQDLLTLTHEMGHFVSYYHYSFGALPYDIAELHSQGNEWLMVSYLEGELPSDVYDVLLLAKLENALVTTIYSTIVDEFEEAVYTSEGINSSDELREIYCEIMEGYGDFFSGNEDYVDPYTYIQHTTLPHPVYYLSYATSEVAALGLYSTACDEGLDTAIELYEALLIDADTTLSFTELLEETKLQSPFDEETFKNLSELIELPSEEYEELPAA